jgi:hypothetical protein
MVEVSDFNTLMKQLEEKAKRRAEELAAMTPDEYQACWREEQRRAKETEEILKQLRGPGFFEGKVGG